MQKCLAKRPVVCYNRKQSGGGGLLVSKGTIAKVMKYELNYHGGCGSFSDMQREVWALQRQTREILNRTIQIAYHWDYLDGEHYKETGEHLKTKEETGYSSIDGYIYSCLNGTYETMASKNLNATIRKAWKKYKEAKKDVLKGTMSIPSYKRDQPILLSKKNVKLTRGEGEPLVELTLFSKKFKEKRQLSSNVQFSMKLNDNTQRAIFTSLMEGTYELGDCQLLYKRPKWFLYLTYTFSPVPHDLITDKILGVDMGETCALYASSYGEYERFVIKGGEITDFARKQEARRRSMQKQAAHCGKGRIGHGTRTRVADVYKVKERIANFRDTINHRYSKALVDYAINHQCGIIQMEDLTGIKEDTGFPKFLRHWTYYDLQAKIEAKEQCKNKVTFLVCKKKKKTKHLF